MDREEIKRRILKEAKELFINEGISKVDMRTVANNSEVSIGTIYNYYSSKGELMAAIIEDFWNEALSFLDDDLKEDNLLINIQYIYVNLFEYLNKFKENWLSELSAMGKKDKDISFKRRIVFLEKIRNHILELIDKDPELEDYPWGECFTKEELSVFIYNNIFLLLNEGREDIDFFLDLLERLLYKK